MTNEEKELMKLSKRLFAVDNPRIYYLVIPKCGCTYVKNVLWRISRDQFFPNQRRIHDVDALFLRAPDVESDPDRIRSASHAFTVVRNPIDRFLSLYFDKIVGAGRENYVPLYKTLTERRGLIGDPVSLQDHQFNLECLADWIGENLSSMVDLAPEAHWTPQSYRANIMSSFNLCILDIDFLQIGLELMLSPMVRGVHEILAAADQNQSERTEAKGRILTVGIRRKVNAIYSVDRRIHRLAKSRWEQILGQQGNDVSLPRFLELGVEAGGD